MLKKKLVLHAPVKVFTLDKFLAIHCVEQYYCFPCREKTESTRKLSNFNFYWTKKKKNVTFFFTFFKGFKDVISHL